MKVIVIGSGAIGSAVQAALAEKGHEVIPVGRSSGSHRGDITDPTSLTSLFQTLAPFDAVACAAGAAAFAPLEQATDEQWASSLASKAMGQINVVRTALPFIADRGSFTLVSGVLSEEYLAGATIATTVNRMVEGFVQSSACELPRGIRINCISPTVLTESTGYHPFFPGFVPVPAWEVGQAYLRAISTPITGRVIKLYKTDS